MYLNSYHDVQVSPLGVWRILRHLDMSQLPSPSATDATVDRCKCYEKPLPGHRVQIDVKFFTPLRGSRAVLGCTHRPHLVSILERLSQALDCVAPDLGELVEKQHAVEAVRAESTRTPARRDQRRAAGTSHQIPAVWEAS